MNKSIFIDMDGVIVDLIKYCAEYNNVSIHSIIAAGHNSVYWENMVNTGNIKEMFANAPWENHGRELLQFFEDRNLSYTFLSRPLREPFSEDCIQGKLLWLKKYGLQDKPVIFERNKSLYAVNANCLLIDDDERNIIPWNESGGTSIWYKSAKFYTHLASIEKFLKT
jgi:5'(3')-deoxyribonucleotidase